jgi:hypothetical protein
MRSKFNENSLDQNGGILGKIDAFGYDGSNYLNSAGIWFTTDGIVNLDTMPGRIEFMTLEEGAEEPSVKMVLKSNGWVGLGTETPSANLQVIGTTQVDSLKISPGASDGYVLTSDASGKAKWKEPSTIGMVPIGTILPWHKNLTGVPSLTDQFVECNGQTISDSESPLNGQSTPDLNTSKRFLRGNTASGAMGGSNTHAHSGNTDNNGSQISINSSGPIPTLNAATVSHSHTYSTPQTEHVPMYFNVVWIMRVK